MKKLFVLFVLIGMSLLFVSSCNMIDDITFDPDETVAKEGNYWTTQGSNIPNTTVTVSQNKKGVATMSFNYNGEDYEIKANVTKTKIQDFVYSGGDENKAFTLCDFDAAVGTKWEYTAGTQKVTREVTHKSTTDDTYAPGLGLMIKVSQVTETIPEGTSVGGYTAEVKQIVWTFNHKFGFIRADVQKNDLSWVTINMTSTNAGSGK